MSEEEKKAIEYLKHILIGTNEPITNGKVENAVKTLLNLIEKLQKERDIYYYEWKTLEADLINNDIIQKDKIKKVDSNFRAT